MPHSEPKTCLNDGRTWHVLQLSAALDEELASALSESVPVIGWKPESRWLGGLLPLPTRHSPIRCSSSFHVHSFARMPGYARPLLSRLARFGPSVSRAIQAKSTSNHDVLVCTTPFLAPVAECWPGPVVYWLTDRIAKYPSARGIDVSALDRRMCASADLVCPNSKRLQDYLVSEAACSPQKIQILPNAVRESNLLSQPLTTPEALPPAVAHREHPIAGVLGNMGSNLDWPLLLEVVHNTSWLTWLFVGPVGKDVSDPVHQKAREQVQQLRNACFTGPKPYGELVHYARSIDVAVLPYFRREPTFSGSSTRFYEHLAACRPMLATRGFAELLEKEPLLQLVDDAKEMTTALEALRAINFVDGHETLRWRESYRSTWQIRADTMRTALASRLAQSHPEAFAVRDATLNAL